MVDFAKLAEVKRITRELDARNVPGTGLSWERVVAFALGEKPTEHLEELFKPEPSLLESLIAPEPNLNEDQQTAWNRILAWVESDERYFVLRGYAGTGKEQPLWCKVQTPQGVREFGSLKVGDYVCGRNGQPTQVKAVYPQGVKPYYKVSFRDGVHTFCGKDHLWSVIDKRGIQRVLTTQQLMDAGLSNSSGYRYRVPLCEPVVYAARKLPIDPYVMGALLGDGCFRGENASVRLSCATYDKAIARKVQKRLSGFTLKGRKTSDNCVEYRIKDRENYRNVLKLTLRKLDLWNCGSRTKFIPKTYLLASVEARWQLLRGLMDTDGSIAGNGKVSWCSSSPRLVKGMVRLVQSLGGMATVAPHSKKLSNQTVVIKTSENPFSLERKASKWRSLANSLVRSITSIELIGTTEQMCITVDAPDNLYLTDNFIVTHNTFLMRKLLSLNSVELLFTAPTNKAAKVLSGSVKRKATTIYSALGLKMTSDEDTRVLKFSERPPYISPGTVIVVDECSMVGRELFEFIDRAAAENNCKIAYIGDPAQLPPVKEERSPTWQATRNPFSRAFLKQVMRYDNQLLTLATRIRDSIQTREYDARITEDNAGNTGVFLETRTRFRRRIAKHNTPDAWRERKVIAWRNRTVLAYNNLIRESFGFTDPFNDGDVLLLAEPIEQNGVIVASIDEEFVVVNVESSVRTIAHRHTEVEIAVWVLAVEGESNQTLIIPKDASELERVLAEMAKDARDAPSAKRRMAWRTFWETKGAFHKVRYGYALTAHRAQGSTYSETFIDQEDILTNSNDREAMRCLYVACTRATTNIYSF